VKRRYAKGELKDQRGPKNNEEAIEPVISSMDAIQGASKCGKRFSAMKGLLLDKEKSAVEV
jgi:hypothetical protein